MQCVCDIQCQQRLDDGSIKWFMPGDLFEFKECPIHFRPVMGEDEAPTIDFTEAGEAELMAAKWKFAEAAAAIKAAYGVELTKVDSKMEVVKEILDIRHRRG